jgi:putative membrane protein
MHWDYGQGWGWGGWLVSMVMMLVFFGAIAAVLVVVARRPADGRSDAADRILAERFARGEIDEDEYQGRRRALHH